jgi:hypothetical protein
MREIFGNSLELLSRHRQQLSVCYCLSPSESWGLKNQLNLTKVGAVTYPLVATVLSANDEPRLPTTDKEHSLCVLTLVVQRLPLQKMKRHQMWHNCHDERWVSLSKKRDFLNSAVEHRNSYLVLEPFW